MVISTGNDMNSLTSASARAAVYWPDNKRSSSSTKEIVQLQVMRIFFERLEVEQWKELEVWNDNSESISNITMAPVV